MRMRMCGRAAGGCARAGRPRHRPCSVRLFSSALGRELAVVKDRDIPASVSGKEGKHGLGLHAYLGRVGGVVAPARSAR